MAIILLPIFIILMLMGDVVSTAYFPRGDHYYWICLAVAYVASHGVVLGLRLLDSKDKFVRVTDFLVGLFCFGCLCLIIYYASAAGEISPAEATIKIRGFEAPPSAWLAGIIGTVCIAGHIGGTWLYGWVMDDI